MMQVIVVLEDVPPTHHTTVRTVTDDDAGDCSSRGCATHQ